MTANPTQDLSTRCHCCERLAFDLAWEQQPEACYSVREAFAWLNKQPGVPHLSYVRVPIADETAPEEKDFDRAPRRA